MKTVRNGWISDGMDDDTEKIVLSLLDALELQAIKRLELQVAKRKLSQKPLPAVGVSYTVECLHSKKWDGLHVTVLRVKRTRALCFATLWQREVDIPFAMLDPLQGEHNG